MRNQAFTTGIPYFIDISPVCDYLTDTLRDEIGHLFSVQLDAIVEDLFLYIFRGEQSKGERVIEKRLADLYIEQMKAILLVRKLFDKAYFCLDVDSQAQLLGDFDYRVSSSSCTLYVKRSSKPHLRPRQLSYDEMVDEMEKSIESGSYVPERMRRALHDYQLRETCD